MWTMFGHIYIFMIVILLFVRKVMGLYWPHRYNKFNLGLSSLSKLPVGSFGTDCHALFRHHEGVSEFYFLALSGSGGRPLVRPSNGIAASSKPKAWNERCFTGEVHGLCAHTYTDVVTITISDSIIILSPPKLMNTASTTTTTSLSAFSPQLPSSSSMMTLSLNFSMAPSNITLRTITLFTCCPFGPVSIKT